MIKPVLAVVSETRKRVQPGCGPQRASQIHQGLLANGQFFSSVYEALHPFNSVHLICQAIQIDVNTLQVRF